LIYPPELKVKETTDTASSASFLDLYLEFDDSGQLSTKIYDKRDLTFLLTSLSLYIFTIWNSVVYYRLCRDGIHFDEILVSEYKLF
jgi:hypothetical protein